MEENEKDTTETGEDSPGAADIDYRGLAEALIFVSKEPLSVEKLAEVVPEKSKSEIKRIVRELRDRYSAPERGIIIEEVAGGFRMMSARWAAPWIFKMLQKRREGRLSPAALETLSIIAYKQPTSRLEIEAIRGVAADQVIKGLLEKDLVRIAGRQNAPGRPFLYGTTKNFLEQFGLPSLDDLPKTEEISFK